VTPRQPKRQQESSAATQIDDILRDSVQRGTRRSALALLATVREARDRLDDLSDKEALHDFRVALRRLRSWLRAFRPALEDTVGSKIERKLKRIANATGSSRDLQVHVQWVSAARKTLSEQARPGASWLLRRLRDEKREADADFRAVIDAKFDRAAENAEEALLRYQASVVDEGERFASVAADMIELQTESLTNALERVSGPGDRAEAHAARIAAKRLRYLLEGVDDGTPSIHQLIEKLKTLQDTLGELHDSQLFGGEIATMIAEVLADEGSQRDGTENGRPANATARKPSPVFGLRVLSGRMRRTETSSFKVYASAWSAEGTARFIEGIASVADGLRAVNAKKRPTKTPIPKKAVVKTPVARKAASRRTAARAR
jgi:CHAD domain-containing protein